MNIYTTNKNLKFVTVEVRSLHLLKFFSVYLNELM